MHQICLAWENVALHGGKRLLTRGFSGGVERGRRVALCGPSGCGKSTFLKAVLGFAVPTEGTICVDGLELSPRTVWQVRRRIAYVPQEADIGGCATVRDVLLQPFAYAANVGHVPASDRVVDLLMRTGLDPAVLDQAPTVLSGGEKQRVALVAALLLDRPLLLLDEPTSALDAAAATAVRRLLQELRDTAVLVVTHDPDVLDGWDAVLSLEVAHA